MIAISESAREHIRRMESRIEKQSAEIARLKQQGEDTAEATKRLAILQRVLEEVRQQLGQLSPTEADAKRARRTAQPRLHPVKKK